MLLLHITGCILCLHTIIISLFTCFGTPRARQIYMLDVHTLFTLIAVLLEKTRYECRTLILLMGRHTEYHQCIVTTLSAVTAPVVQAHLGTVRILGCLCFGCSRFGRNLLRVTRPIRVEKKNNFFHSVLVQRHQLNSNNREKISPCLRIMQHKCWIMIRHTWKLKQFLCVCFYLQM